MASKAAVRPLASVSAAIGFRQAVTGQRSFAQQKCQSQSQLLLRPRAVQLPQQRLQQCFQQRRGYAEVSPETQRVVKRRSWRFLVWTWRITYLSAIAGTIYLGYQIYDNRTPADQEEPDPTKKTLVVLGMDTRAVGMTAMAIWRAMLTAS